MLITFHSKDHAPIMMHGEPALQLLALMGLEPKVPGGLFADDVPQALWQLQESLNELQAPANSNPQAAAGSYNDDDKPVTVALGTRAVPLLEMLKRAVKANHPIHWD